MANKRIAVCPYYTANNITTPTTYTVTTGTYAGLSFTYDWLKLHPHLGRVEFQYSVTGNRKIKQFDAIAGRILQQILSNELSEDFIL
jgi:hypothetical protein